MRRHAACRLVTVLMGAASITVGATGLDPYGVAPAPGVHGPASAAASEAGTQFRDGLQALQKGDLDTATRHFEAAARAAPTDPDPLLALAEVAIRRGHMDAAEAHVNQAMKVAPRSALPFGASAYLLERKKDYAGALAALDRAIELQATSGLQDRRGDIYATRLNDPERAMTAYRAALALNDNDAHAHYGVGVLLARKRSFAEAGSELRRATELAPGNAQTWVALGGARAGLGDSPGALSAYDEALKIHPGLPAALTARSNVLMAQGHTDQAIAGLEQALRTDPRSTATLVSLGMAEQKAKRLAEAEKHYRAALELEPQQPVASNNLAFMLADARRDLDEALRLATIAVERAPASSDSAQDTLAWVRRARGELQAAAKILEPVAARTTDPSVMYHLGVVYAEMGRKQDAVVAFDKALKLAPGYQPAHDARRTLAGG